MATLRAAAAPVTSVFRFASQPATASRRCAHCLKAQRCPFSSFRPALQSSKRPLMTESAYRPQTLEPEMPPPRNAGVPETSIAGSQQQQQQSWPPPAPWQRKDSGAAVSEREGEAQKSKPTLAAQPPTTTQNVAQPQPSSTTTTPKKSKLRPRKAALTVSPTALAQLRRLLAQPTSKLVRVGVKNRGCSGLAYHLEYVDKPGAFDETVEPEPGVKVLIDSKALFSIIGSEMDWQEDKLSARFVFRNPNVTESCGCGESFSIS
ncbi:hypothetical protein B0A55_03862 [Friedmanniomyces simplex]|uniref:Iron-sulfur assembly protein 1 n=1 Tax=Friedmanniomyces simplex TaxID=329884 RepID=A0A4U0XHC5_9PEZI|nr:hypothetical protein B0A55_03862 [Friedmanniomyces simplex]